MNRPLNIIIVENSTIINEGLISVFNKSGFNSTIKILGTIDTIDRYINSCIEKENIVIINPTLIQNNIKAFQNLKANYTNVGWLACVYILFEPGILNLFDGIISISDNPDKIITLVENTLNSKNNEINDNTTEILSERETDVLQLLALGMQNKEIADKLNISINTVITHRKNITQKTGIKTTSGLTIYAVVKKLITIDHLYSYPNK